MRQKISFHDFIKITFKHDMLWVCILLTHVVGIYGVCYTVANGFSYIHLMYFLCGWFATMILGITAGFHRMLSHKSFETYAPIRCILILCGILAGQGSPIFWAAIHRYIHHPNSDTNKDLHSPIHGFWHSWFLWLWKIESDDIDPRKAVEFLHDPFLRFTHKWYLVIYLFLHGILAIISIELWIWFAIIPSIVTFHSYSITNSLTHLKKLGYRNFNTKDNSTNIWWLWPIILGDCWHNNHHARVKSFHFGNKNWWEIDPAGFVIGLIKK